jgi:hypothetical protein
MRFPARENDIRVLAELVARVGERCLVLGYPRIERTAGRGEIAPASEALWFGPRLSPCPPLPPRHPPHQLPRAPWPVLRRLG